MDFISAEQNATDKYIAPGKTVPQIPVIEELENSYPIEESTAPEPESSGVGDVVKTTIVRTTKIVKKVTQNTEQSVNVIIDAPEPETEKTEPEEPIEEASGGVTKTTTVRTTKIVKKLNEDGETTTEETRTASDPVTVREPRQLFRKFRAILQPHPAKSMGQLSKLRRFARCALQRGSPMTDVFTLRKARHQVM